MQSLTIPSAANQSRWEQIGTLVFGIILLMPVLGCFFPPDLWLHYSGDDVTARQMNASLPMTAAIARLSSAVAIFWLFKYWRGYLPNMRYSILILLQLTAFASSYFWSEVPSNSFKQIYTLFITYILMLYIVHRYTIKEFVAIFTWVTGISAAGCFAVIILLPGLSHNIGSTDYGGVWRGAYVQKNVLGFAASIGILVSAYAFYSNATSRKFAAAVFAANTILIIGSDSITSILTTAIGLMIYGLAYLSRSFLGRLMLVFVVLGVGMLAIAGTMSVDSLSSLVGRTSGLTGRTQLWYYLQGMIAQRPLHGYGIGFWGFQNQQLNSLWLELKWAAPEAHNDELDILLQTGYVGFAFYVLNNVSALMLGLRRFNNLDDGSTFCLVIIAVFFYRSYAETSTLIESGRTILILYVAEAYLYKISFARKFETRRLRSPQNVPTVFSMIP